MNERTMQIAPKATSFLAPKTSNSAPLGPQQMSATATATPAIRDYSFDERNVATRESRILIGHMSIQEILSLSIISV